MNIFFSAGFEIKTVKISKMVVFGLFIPGADGGGLCTKGFNLLLF